MALVQKPEIAFIRAHIVKSSYNIVQQFHRTQGGLIRSQTSGLQCPHRAIISLRHIGFCTRANAIASTRRRHCEQAFSFYRW